MLRPYSLGGEARKEQKAYSSDYKSHSGICGSALHESLRARSGWNGGDQQKVGSRCRCR